MAASAHSGPGASTGRHTQQTLNDRQAAALKENQKAAAGHAGRGRRAI
jgi:hypothetical protein